MRVRFWGVRGSVPFSTPSTVRHGSNTACVEVRDDDGRLLIIDAGSGIVGLGDTLDASVPDIPILLSHYHWDHIQGLPFCAPLFESTRNVTLWAPAISGSGSDIQTMFAQPFFPVPFDQLPSGPMLAVMLPGEQEINGFSVRTQPLNHPGGAYAYRIAGAERDLVYASDHEFGDGEIDAALAEFSRGAGALILDAHYTPDERPAHKGWGHADWKECAEFAKACGVGQLWLTHHKPGRTDQELTRISADARKVFPPTSMASEGDTFDL